jgi:hypothetical protein
MNDKQTGRIVGYLTEMFRFQAWVAMGKVTNPMTGEVERDLGSARAAIDLLAELETKTEGNRSGDETKILQGVLTELRMNYLDEMKKPDEPREPGPEPETGTEPDAGSEDVAAAGEPRGES